jgi:hypothetical protein
MRYQVLKTDCQPEDIDLDNAANVHKYTYGITSDPMTEFTVVLSALIHDVDHPGVPNSVLAMENPDLASNITTRVSPNRNRSTQRGRF